jgi:16S rRNA processing protein RimM
VPEQLNVKFSGQFITVARVAKTQGRHGEVAADLYTDFPEKFAERTRLSGLARDGSRKDLEVEDHWPHKGWMVFKFAGVDDMDAAENLIGYELQIPAAERAELEEGAAYVSDLVGCAVFDAGKQVGTVKDVEFTSGSAPILIVADGKREHMVPFAESFLKRLDVAAKKIEMELPEGLLELDAPLSSDEKKSQHQK